MADDHAATPKALFGWSLRKWLRLTSADQMLSTDLQKVKCKVYNDLDVSKSHFRLLLLMPSTDDNAPIQCQLKQVSLNNNPEYEAVSYAWGNADLVKTIVLDEREIKITLNAWTALSALRYHGRPRTLWIDAICINQQDRAEKKSQLVLMGTIYKKASSVRVWLGPSEDHENIGLAALRGLANGDQVKELLGSWGLRSDERGLVMRFFDKPWWTRLWVVQEVALARHAMFQTGNEELDFEDLISAYINAKSFLNEHFQGFIGGCFDGGQEDFLRKFASVETLRLVRKLSVVAGVDHDIEDGIRAREAAMNWLTIANLLRDKEISYDEDRLDALYGLLPSSVVARPGMTHLPGTGIEKIYADVTYNVLEASQCLMVFNFLGHRTSDKSSGLPSWVPDWRLAPTNVHGSSLRVKRDHLYNASLGSEFYLRRLSSNTICLKGFCVGLVIGWCGTPMVPTASIILKYIYKEWWTAVQRLIPPIRLSPTTFMRTMTWDCAPCDEEGTLKRLDSNELEAMQAAHERAVRVCEGDVTYDGRGQAPEDARRTDYMMNCAKGRAMIITDQFSLGMAHDNVQVGDRIFIVSGNTHPIILRPSTKYADTWHAIGECYLHEFMDGFAVHHMEAFKGVMAFHEAILETLPEVSSLSGLERHPRLDKIVAQPDGLWKWLLIE